MSRWARHKHNPLRLVATSICGVIIFSMVSRTLGAEEFSGRSVTSDGAGGATLLRHVDDSARPLHDAALNGSTAIVEKLVNAGEDPNAYDGLGVSPLHWAVFGDVKTGGVRTDEYVAVVEMLLTRGANPNRMPLGLNESLIKTRHNLLHGSSLSLAASTCGDRVVATLLKGGADPSLQNPLALAALAGCPESVRLLLAHGASPNKTHTDGRPVLDSLGAQVSNGFYREHIEVAKLLLEAGAKPVGREQTLRAALSEPSNRFIGRRWAQEVLMLLQKAMKEESQPGEARSSGSTSDRKN